MNDHVINIIARGLDAASGPLGQVGGAVSGLGGIAAGVATGGLALAGAAIIGLGAAGVAAAVGITSLALAAAEVEGTRGTFETLMDDLGGSALAMDELQVATRGMVSEAGLMAASNKFVAMGLTDTIESTAEMAEMATQLGLAMGEDATGSMENFALMMANQSIPRLDSFGISSAKVRERIKELMEETEGLSREQAFNQAVMEQGRLTMERVGEQGENAAATTARWTATLEDLRLNIGQAFIPALEAVRGPILDLADKYGPMVIEWANIAGEWLGERLPLAISWLESTWTTFWPIAQKSLLGFWNAIKPGLVWIGSTFQKYTSEYLPRLRDAWDTLSEGFGVISGMWHENLKPALQQLWSSLGIGQGETSGIAGVMGTFQGTMAKIMASGLIGAIKIGIEGITAGVRLAVIAIETARNVIDGFKRALDNIRGVIQFVKDRIWELRNAFNNLTLPSWLTPGSPTPLELGLRGINEALARMPDLSMTFASPTMAPALATAGGNNQSVSNVVIHNHFGADSVRSDQDILNIADAIRDALEIRGVQPAL